MEFPHRKKGLSFQNGARKGEEKWEIVSKYVCVFFGVPGGQGNGMDQEDMDQEDSEGAPCPKPPQYHYITKLILN